MTFLIIILFVALALVAWRRQLAPSRALNTLTIVLAVACLGTVALEWRRPQIEAARWNARANRVQEAVAFELGRTVAQAFPQGGDVLVLLPGLPAKFPEDGTGAAQVKALQAGFGRDNLHAVPVGYTPATADEVMEIQADWPLSGVPFAKVNEWFAGHQGAVAVVAFALVGTGRRWQDPPQMPPLFLCGPPALETPEQWMGRVKLGILEAVAVTHPGFDWENAVAQGSLPEVFQKCCDLVTPANFAVVRSRLIGGAQ